MLRRRFGGFLSHFTHSARSAQAPAMTANLQDIDSRYENCEVFSWVLMKIENYGAVIAVQF